MHLIMGKEWGYPNIQIQPNRSKLNQIKSNRPNLYPNQIKLKVRFDLIYLFTSLLVLLYKTAWEQTAFAFSTSVLVPVIAIWKQ